VKIAKKSKLRTCDAGSLDQASNEAEQTISAMFGNFGISGNSENQSGT
jgi:hypothetical protein